LDYDEDQQVELCGGIGDASEWMTAEEFLLDNNNHHQRQPQQLKPDQHQSHQMINSVTFGSQMISPNSRTPY